MESDLKNVSHMTDEELRNDLLKHGEIVGPVTSGTRNILECKLRKLLMPTQAQDNLSALSNEFNKPTPILRDKVQEADIYYGLFIPRHFVVDGVDMKKVYTDRSECLSLLKKFQGSRFKSFPIYDEALAFSEYGPIIVTVPTTPDVHSGSSGTHSGTTSVSSEKPSPFRGPKYQDSLKFRKAIESGNFDFFTECVQSNPRYLVSSGDTPSILREGPRYNALHFACKNNRSDICQKILSLVADPGFFQRLYPDDSCDSSERRSSFLLDLYLNTPDKGFNESPLHFACKEGAIDCVRILLSYSGCDKSPLNRYNQTPIDVGCARAKSNEAGLKEKIEALFEDRYYVPVLRDEDKCLPARIGSPWSPSVPTETTPPSTYTASSIIPSSPLSPAYKVKGYAGPMSPQKAELFYSRWKKSSSVPSPSRNSPQRQMAALRIGDLQKGVERVGRNLALELEVEWMEFWDFFGDFVNISSIEGLQKLDQHLKAKYKEVIEQRNKERLDETLMNLKEKSGTDFSLYSYDTKEHPDDTTRSSLSSMGELCQNLEALRLNASLSPNPDTDNVYRKSVGHGNVGSFHHHTSSTTPGSYSQNNNIESPLNISVDELSTSTSQYNFAIQSTRISAQRIASILCDISQSISLHVGPDFLVTRKLRNKVKPEVSSLKKVLSQCLSANHSDVTLDFGFVHVFLASKTAENLIENASASDLFMALETVKLLADNMESFEQSSSDEEEETSIRFDDIEREESLVHFQCVARNLYKSLSIAVKMSKEGKEDDQINLSELEDCKCRFNSQSTLNPKDRRLYPVDVRSLNNSLNKKRSTSNVSTGSGDRFSRAHSFLHRVLFGTKENEQRNNLNTSDVQPVFDSTSVVQHLTFDNDGTGSLNGSHGEDSESFTSALSSFGEEPQMTTPEDALEIYINGRCPSRYDYDALVALEGLIVDEIVYPHVAQWMKLVESFPCDDRKRWRTVDLFGNASSTEAHQHIGPYSPFRGSFPIDPTCK